MILPLSKGGFKFMKLSSKILVRLHISTNSMGIFRGFFFRSQPLSKATAFAASGNTKGGSITVPLTSYLTGLESAVWQLPIFVFTYKSE
jgi:hypothetical protein